MVFCHFVSLMETISTCYVQAGPEEGLWILGVNKRWYILLRKKYQHSVIVLFRGMPMMRLEQKRGPSEVVQESFSYQMLELWFGTGLERDWASGETGARHSGEGISVCMSVGNIVYLVFQNCKEQPLWAQLEEIRLKKG